MTSPTIPAPAGERLAPSRPAHPHDRRPRSRLVPVLVGLALLAGVVARFAAPSALWLDEAQSVAIARLPLPDLFQGLREDGSPPLYYLLLHGWIALFGTSTAAVRALSGVISVLTLPLAYRVSRQLAGRRVALAVLLLLASSPFAIRYASETRMYSLLLLLSFVLAAAVRWVVRRPGPWPVVGLAVATGLLLLTHLWAFHLVAVVAILALVALRRWRAPALRVLVGLVGGFVLFLPWLPSFLTQLAHTGTPWAGTQGLSSLPVALGAWDGGIGVQSWLFGLLLVVLAVVGAFAVPRPHRPGARLELAARLPWRRAVLVAGSLGTLVVAALVSAVTASGVSGRYTTVALPAFLVLVALGLSALPTARTRGIALFVLVGFGLGCAVPGLAQPRSQAPAIAAGLRAAAPGDLVVFCPDQLGPSVSRVAPAGLQLVVYPDLAPAARVDWTDYAERNDSRLPDAVAADVLARSGGKAVWVVTGSGYRVPSDATCHAFVDDLAAFRGDPTLVVGRSGSYYEGARLQVFSPAP
jgi:mannosyltransferase